MTYVYVLVSDETDYYYEQALMSVASLRLHMPKADVVVLVDNKTNDSFKASKERSLLSTMATIKPIDFEDKVSKVERSRLIKTSIPDYVEGSFLYIDCDTIICDDLSDIEQYPYPISGVLDGHVRLDEHIHHWMFLRRDKKLGFKGTEALGYNINGGLLLANDPEAAKTLFAKWNELWKYAAYQKNDRHDQPPLNEAIRVTGTQVELLPGEWNCQLEHGGLAYLEHAKILHYYSSEMKDKRYRPYYKLADKALQQRIKDTGKLDDDIMQMLEQPKLLFNQVHLVNDPRIVAILMSPLSVTLGEIALSHHKLFRALELPVIWARKGAKKLLRRK